MCFFPSFLYISILSGWNEKTKKKKWFGFDKCKRFMGLMIWWKTKKKTNWKTKINFSPTCIRGSRATYAIAQIRLDLFSSRKATALKMFINSNIDVVNAADKPPKWPQMACLSLERQKKGSLTNNKFQMVTNKYKWRRTNHGFPLKREKVEKNEQRIINSEPLINLHARRKNSTSNKNGEKRCIQIENEQIMTKQKESKKSKSQLEISSPVDCFKNADQIHAHTQSRVEHSASITLIWKVTYTKWIWEEKKLQRPHSNDTMIMSPSKAVSYSEN